MRFAVTKVCGGGAKARAGMLQIAGSNIETPALLLSTRKGLPAFVSRDLLASLPLPDSLLLHVCPTHFMEGPPSKTISNIGGLHHMLGLPDHILIAAAGDSIESLPTSEASNKFGASFETPAGRRLVKPSDYMELISCMKPNLWASLADEVPAWVTEKRNKVSVERTLRWLDACIALDEDSGANTLGVVVGGSSIELRKLCATEVSKRNVSGFWIGGLGFGDSPEERCSILDAAVGCLPPEKPRVVSRLGLPGLVFQVSVMSLVQKDTSRIVDSCSCFTCQNHTRAYLNHLLNVHEMLAQILLEIHNTHHYLCFFRLIRDTIKTGQFDRFRQQFVQDRRAYLAAAVI
ncbi:hypothetical protein OsI_32722 [Oryza sativa Indica Group]|uniref:Queuine tRNA-ribosyltransferase accessory subunit 2 n=1 Tax=Oryza sativa subsp. indica TaxID=39946 RepID=A2Z4Z7_ORYSI|nr:hypothetical protein OsI_32722 [Oryza sativa Indica Group]